MDADETADHLLPTAGPATFRETPWRRADLLIGLAPLVLVFLVRPFLGFAPRVFWITASLLIIVWMLVYPLRRARPALPRLRAVLLEGLLALLALPVVFMLVAGVSVLARPLGELGSHPLEAVAGSADRFELLALIVLATTLGPVAEEVFYRGMLYNALRRRIYRGPAALVQALFFGFSHPFGLAQQVVISAIGLSLAGLYEWRKTLVGPILLHAFVNVVGLTVLLSQLASPVLGVLGTNHENGCVISAVVSGTAAEASGLRVGDILTSVDGERVTSFADLTRVIRAKKAGDRVAVDYIRDGKAFRIEAILKERPR